MSNLAYGLLWIFVFAVPWENIILLPGIGTIGRLLGLVAAPVGILTILMRGRLRPLSMFHIFALCYLVWAALTIVWSVDQDATATWIQRVGQAAAIPWLIWELAGTSRRRSGLLQAYILGAYVSCIDTFLNYRAGVARFIGRFTAENFNPNDLGFLLGLGIPIAWYLGITQRNLILRWVNRLYLPVGAVAILLTASRSSLITMVLALTIVPLTLPWLTRGMRLGALGVALALVTAVTLYVPPATWKRLSTTTEEIESGTLNDRRIIWSAGLQLFPRHPIGGVGAGAFAEAVRPFLGDDKTAHNTYISVLIQEGAVGFIFFALMLLSLFFHARAGGPLERRLGFVLVFTLLVGLIPRAWEHYKATWLVFGLLLLPTNASAREYAATLSASLARRTIARSRLVRATTAP